MLRYVPRKAERTNPVKLPITKRKSKPTSSTPLPSPWANVIPLRDPAQLLLEKHRVISEARSRFDYAVETVKRDLTAGVLVMEEADQILRVADQTYSQDIKNAETTFLRQCPSYGYHQG